MAISDSFASSNPLLAGAAHADITPELGHDLAGWIEPRPATRRDSPILAHALVLSDGTEQIALLTCDLVGIPDDLTERIHAAIERACGIPAKNVFIFPTHNHYGPSVWGNYAQTSQANSVEQQYEQALPDRMAQAVHAAKDALRPAHLGIGYDAEATHACNSRYWRKDGTINWVSERGTHWASDSGPLDPEIAVLRVMDDQDHTIAALYRYACHANAEEQNGWTTISWDWAGYASQAIENAMGGEALFLVGTCGNIHPKAMNKGVARVMGADIGAAAVRAARNAQPVAHSPLVVRRRDLKLPARDWNTLSEQQIEIFVSQARETYDDKTYTAVRDVFLNKLYELRTSSETQGLVLPLSAIVLGELAIICIPGELFVELGLEIKKHSPFKHTLVVEILSAYRGYLPTRKAFAEGGYQTAVGARIAPGGGEQIVGAAVALLEELNQSTAS
jgi:hypothetical protein